MKLAIAATLAALAMFGAGCDEYYTKIDKNRVLVRDRDGAVDQNNIAAACGGAVNVDGWITTKGTRAPVIVTCKEGK